MRKRSHPLSESEDVIDAIILEKVLKHINMTLDDDLVFYTYDIETVYNYVTAKSRP